MRRIQAQVLSRAFETKLELQVILEGLDSLPA